MSRSRTENSPAPIAGRAFAVKAALGELGEKGSLQEGQIDSILEATQVQFEEEMNWRNGAKVVARAWTDSAYHARLIADGTAACAELGFEGVQGEYIVVLEDEPELHHVIVCTQCSCTAWPVLGLPPDWYKSPEYRARVAREPRKVLHEMGLDLPTSIEIRVWDTTAETRYIVLPRRPSGTEGWDEDRLTGIVTREAMIGVAMIEND